MNSDRQRRQINVRNEIISVQWSKRCVGYLDVLHINRKTGMRFGTKTRTNVLLDEMKSPEQCHWVS